jgi:hypothetical protein
MKRLLAVAVAVDEDGGAGEPRAPIAELEVVATIEDFGPLAAGAAPGASSALMASIYGGDAAPPSTAAAVAREVEAEALLKQRELEAKMQLQQEQLDEREVRLREGETRLRMREKELDRRIEGVLAQRLSEMEAEWAQRKERRERMEVQASTEFARIESKLRDTLTEAERRERTLRDLQTDAQRAVASKMEELSLERTRYKEESKLHVELEQQRSKDLVERIAQLRKRCATAEQRSASAEEKLTVLRVDMRSRPETVSDAHEKIAGLESSNMQMQLALEAAMAKTVSTTRAQAREGSLSRCRSLSRFFSSPSGSFFSFVRSFFSFSFSRSWRRKITTCARGSSCSSWHARYSGCGAFCRSTRRATISGCASPLLRRSKSVFSFVVFLHFAVLFYSSPTRPAHSSPTTSPILAELCSTVIASASRS